MATTDPPTTITIRSSTRRLLEEMKGPDETYDELLQELAEEYYPDDLMRVLRERVSELHAGRAKLVPAHKAFERLRV
jgi:hypothetical protein